MSDTVVHHINISYDESDERVKNFVKYLKSEDRKTEMETYFNQAKQSPEGKLYLSDKKNNDFTLICTNGYNCTLGLRGI
jgi:hypothetical protein